MTVVVVDMAALCMKGTEDSDIGGGGGGRQSNEGVWKMVCGRAGVFRGIVRYVRWRREANARR